MLAGTLAAALQARGFQLVCAVLLVAVLLTRCSSSVLANFPLALAMVLVIRWLLLRTEQRCQVRAVAMEQWGQACWGADNVLLATPRTPSIRGVGLDRASAKSWRELVNSPVVEGAWETLCGSIVQEFIYDTWYAYITPDKEFPADVRRVLCAAFGRLAHRARRLDLRAALNDVSELLMEQIELYRDTRESIVAAQAGAAAPHGRFGADMSAAARERALRREMQAESNLHPALQGSDGHYRFLRAVSEGVVGLLLDPADLSRTSTRVVARELLAACVLRPLLLYFTPYYAHRALYTLLRDVRPPPRGGVPAGGSPGAGDGGSEEDQARPEGAARELARQRAAARAQLWQFEERLARSAVEEEGAVEEAHGLRSRLRTEMAAHARSRSMDVVLTGPSAKQDSPGSSTARSDGAAPPPAAAGSTGRRSSSDVGPGGSKSRPPLPAPAAGLGVAGEQLSRRGSLEVAPSGSSENLLWATAGPWMRSMVARRATAPAPGSHSSPPQAPADASQPRQHRQHHQETDWESVPPPPAARHADDAASSPAGQSERQAQQFGVGHLLAPSQPQAAALRASPFEGSGRGPSPGRAPSGGRELLKPGFRGPPRADVVAVDLQTSGSKDYVVYKIRVGDEATQWTVSRRFRHFEVLHRLLKLYTAYRLKLPPKHIFKPAQDIDLVMERRAALDSYLKSLLSEPQLRLCSDVYEFLSPGSDLYGEVDPVGSGFLRRAMHLTARAGSITMGGGGNGKGGEGGGGKAGAGGVARSQGSFMGGLRQRRSSSVPFALDRAAEGGRERDDASTGSASSSLGRPAAAAAPASHGAGAQQSVDQRPQDGSSPVAVRGRSPALGTSPGQSKGLAGRTANAAAGLLGRAGLGGRKPKDEAVAGDSDERSDAGGGAPMRSRTSFSGGAAAPAAGGAADGTAQLSTSPSRRFLPSLQTFRKPKGGSPQGKKRSGSPSRRRQRPGADDSGHASDGGGLSRRSSRGPPARQGSDLASALDLAGWQGVPDGPGSQHAGGQGAGPAGNAPAQAAGQGPASFPLAPSLEAEYCAGISAPLYEVVDTLFELRTRGFFRRQVLSVARQALSLLAGDAIDDYLAAKLRQLRSEHVVSRVISLIQHSLWPGGVWYTRMPPHQGRTEAQQAAAGAAASERVRRQGSYSSAETGAAAHAANSANSASSIGAALQGMTAEEFLDPGPPPLDEEEVRDAACKLLAQCAPMALVRLLGKNAYNSAMADVLEMLQSPTFLQQLGYGVLEIVAVMLFPELKPLFRTLESGGLNTLSTPAGTGA